MGQLIAALNSQCGRGKKALIQLNPAAFFFFFADQTSGEVLQEIGERQEEQQAQDLENGIDDSDGYRIDRSRENGRMKQLLYDQIDDQEHRGADHIEAYMDGCRPFPVPGSADRRQDSRDACADIGAHDQRNSSGKTDLARGAQRLQDTDAGRRRLYDHRQQDAGQQAQKRILEKRENLMEVLVLPQVFHSSAHDLHAVHQRGKAQQNQSDPLVFLIFVKHVENDADQSQNWRKAGRLQHGQDQIAAANAA